MLKGREGRPWDTVTHPSWPKKVQVQVGTADGCHHLPTTTKSNRKTELARVGQQEQRGKAQGMSATLSHEKNGRQIDRDQWTSQSCQLLFGCVVRREKRRDEKGEKRENR